MSPSHLVQLRCEKKLFPFTYYMKLLLRWNNGNHASQELIVYWLFNEGAMTHFTLFLTIPIVSVLMSGLFWNCHDQLPLSFNQSKIRGYCSSMSFFSRWKRLWKWNIDHLIFVFLLTSIPRETSLAPSINHYSITSSQKIFYLHCTTRRNKKDNYKTFHSMTALLSFSTRISLSPKKINHKLIFFCPIASMLFSIHQENCLFDYIHCFETVLQ